MICYIIPYYFASAKYFFSLERKLPILFILKGQPGGLINKYDLCNYPTDHVYVVQKKCLDGCASMANMLERTAKALPLYYANICMILTICALLGPK